MKLPITISISAGAVAWYAAVVSTVLLLIKYLDYRRERVNVVVEVGLDYQVYGAAHPYDPNKTYISVTVRNRGRRSVTISQVGYISRKKGSKHGLFQDSLTHGPRELTEGKSTAYMIEQDLLDLSNIKYFVAYDQAGRQYKGKLKRK